MMTREERIAYQRGYYAGHNNTWPASRPPLPPDAPAVRDLIIATNALRDAVGDELAKFAPDDEVAARLTEPLARVAEALTRITEHVTKKEEGS
jgi:hypothetical protein